MLKFLIKCSGYTYFGASAVKLLSEYVSNRNFDKFLAENKKDFNGTQIEDLLTCSRFLGQEYHDQKDGLYTPFHSTILQVSPQNDTVSIPLNSKVGVILIDLGYANSEDLVLQWISKPNSGYKAGDLFDFNDDGELIFKTQKDAWEFCESFSEFFSNNGFINTGPDTNYMPKYIGGGAESNIQQIVIKGIVDDALATKIEEFVRSESSNEFDIYSTDDYGIVHLVKHFEAIQDESFNKFIDQCAHTTKKFALECYKAALSTMEEGDDMQGNNEIVEYVVDPIEQV